MNFLNLVQFYRFLKGRCHGKQFCVVSKTQTMCGFCNFFCLSPTDIGTAAWLCLCCLHSNVVLYQLHRTVHKLCCISFLGSWLMNWLMSSSRLWFYLVIVSVSKIQSLLQCRWLDNRTNGFLEKLKNKFTQNQLQSFTKFPGKEGLLVSEIITIIIIIVEHTWYLSGL